VRHLYHLSRPTIRKPGHQMTKPRVASAALFAVLLSPVHAMPQAVSRSYSADFYVGGCKDFLAANSSFFAGRCVGAVEVLDALNDDTKLFCPPEGATNLQRVNLHGTYLIRQTRNNQHYSDGPPMMGSQQSAQISNIGQRSRGQCLQELTEQR